jgi:membrane protease YdiL (CAAX protease family)
MFDISNRSDFVKLAVLFESGLIVVAFGICCLFDVKPVAYFTWSVADIGWGILLAIPMFGLFLLGWRFPFGPLRPMKQFLLEALGPPLAACRWYDLAAIAAVAGVSEELLFRGVLYPLTGRWVSGVLFGLAHFITPLYALLAGLAGLALGDLMERTNNLLAPMVAHGVYDFLAFVAVARSVRRQPPISDPDEL